VEERSQMRLDLLHTKVGKRLVLLPGGYHLAWVKAMQDDSHCSRGDRHQEGKVAFLSLERRNVVAGCAFHTISRISITKQT